MIKKLRTRDYLLFGLAIIDELFREFHDPGGSVSASYKNLYGFVPKKYRRRSFSALLSRLQKEGYLRKKNKGKELYYRLTDKGRTLINKKKLLFGSPKEWDKKVWLIIFDVREGERRKRDKLRKVLQTFGFAMWQKSVWISPFLPTSDFNEYLRQEELTSFVHLFSIEAKMLGDLKSFAQKIWRTEKIASLYKDWTNEASFCLEQRRKGDEKIQKKEIILSRFLQIILQDPFLPEEFLPTDWPHERAKNLFKKLTIGS